MPGESRVECLTRVVGAGAVRSMSGIRYRIIRRRVKYPRLEIWGNEIWIIVPGNVDPWRMMRENRGWLIRQIEIARKAAELSGKIGLVPRTRRKFRSLVERVVREYAEELGVEVNRIFVRRVKSAWGSCSGRGNITINAAAQWLPERLVRYIAYHEVCHLRRWRHDREFERLVREKFPDHEDLDLQLQACWIKLREREEKRVRS
jgi:predicted metal-dependent hydrolase